MNLAAAIRAEISEALTLNPSYAALITGGLLDQAPQRAGGPAATPSAFTAKGTMLVNIAVPDAQLVPNGQAADVPDAIDGVVGIWFYGNDTPTDRTSIDTLRGLIYRLFREGTMIEVETGVYGFCEWAGALGTGTNYDEFAGSVLGNEEFRITFQRGS